MLRYISPLHLPLISATSPLYLPYLTCAPTCCAADAVVIGPTMTHRSAMSVEEDIHRQRAPCTPSTPSTRSATATICLVAWVGVGGRGEE